MRKQKMNNKIDEKYAVIVNEDNVPYKCTIHNSLDEAIESIGKISYEDIFIKYIIQDIHIQMVLLHLGIINFKYM